METFNNTRPLKITRISFMPLTEYVELSHDGSSVPLSTLLTLSWDYADSKVNLIDNQTQDEDHLTNHSTNVIDESNSPLDSPLSSINYDMFLKLILEFTDTSMLINIAHVNNIFYANTRDIYKKSNPYDLLLDAVLTKNRYVIGADGLLDCTKFQRKLEIYKHIIINQDRHKLTDSFVMEFAVVLQLTKEEQILSWASYGDCRFLKTALFSNIQIHNESKCVIKAATEKAAFSNICYQTGEKKKRNEMYSRCWYSFHCFCYGSPELLKIMPLYPFYNVPTIAATENNKSVMDWIMDMDYSRGNEMFGYGWKMKVKRITK